MDTLSAFALGEANRHKPLRVFDWDRAAELIRHRKPAVASAGLGSDWEWTGGEIYRDGRPVPRADTYTYLASTWAVPELDLDGDVMPCWVWESEVPAEWAGDRAKVYWPESAVRKLEGSLATE